MDKNDIKTNALNIDFISLLKQWFDYRMKLLSIFKILFSFRFDFKRIKWRAFRSMAQIETNGDGLESRL